MGRFSRDSPAPRADAELSAALASLRPHFDFSDPALRSSSSNLNPTSPRSDHCRHRISSQMCCESRGRGELSASNFECSFNHRSPMQVPPGLPSALQAHAPPPQLALAPTWGENLASGLGLIRASRYSLCSCRLISTHSSTYYVTYSSPSAHAGQGELGALGSDYG